MVPWFITSVDSSDVSVRRRILVVVSGFDCRAGDLVLRLDSGAAGGGACEAGGVGR